MSPSQPPSSSSWPSYKTAAVTLGIVLGLVLLALSAVLSRLLLKRAVMRWIIDEIDHDRRWNCHCCRCKPSARDRIPPEAQSGPHLSVTSNETPTPPRLSTQRSLPSPPSREREYRLGQYEVAAPYHPRQDGMTRVEVSEPRPPPNSSLSSYPWVAEDERTNYRAPYVNSATASEESFPRTRLVVRDV